MTKPMHPNQIATTNSNRIVDQFLEGMGIDFDVSRFVTEDIERIEQPVDVDFLYKYYPPHLFRAFCGHPRVRFTQRTALNDPFELSTRWEQVGFEPLRDAFKIYLRRSADELLKRPDTIIKILLEDPKLRHLRSVPHIEQQLMKFLGSPKASVLFAEGRARIELSLIALDQAMSDAHMAASLEKMAEDVGIFSLSETGTNQQLWGLYAQSGQGFVVRFNARHAFFKSANGNSTLKKVIYTDDTTPTFLKNPYYFFLVKNAEWAFEREWRMIKKLGESDVTLPNGIHLWDIPRGAIDAVILGYSEDSSSKVDCAKQLASFDPGVRLLRSTLNNTLRRIEIDGL